MTDSTYAGHNGFGGVPAAAGPGGPSGTGWPSPAPASRGGRLDRVLSQLLGQAPEIEAAAVVSFDGLPMASALPADLDEDRVAAMSAALLSLGERAADGLGRGGLTQVYVEGEHGTVILVSAANEAVLVAVADRDAKPGLVLFEVRRAAAAIGEALQSEWSHVDEEPPADPYVPTVTPLVTGPTPLTPRHDGDPAVSPWSTYRTSRDSRAMAASGPTDDLGSRGPEPLPGDGYDDAGLEERAAAHEPAERSAWG